MTDLDQHHCQAIAVFHPGLIAELVRLPSAAKALHTGLRETAKRCYTIPGSPRTKLEEPHP